VPCAFWICSTITDQPGLHSLYNTATGGAATTFAGRNGFTAAGFTAFTAGRTVKRFADRFTTRFAAAFLMLRRAADLRAVRRVVLVARIASALSPRLLISAASFSHLLLVSTASLTAAYFRR
jgi:hypothetical protein